MIPRVLRFLPRKVLWKVYNYLDEMPIEVTVGRTYFEIYPDDALGWVSRALRLKGEIA